MGIGTGLFLLKVGPYLKINITIQRYIGGNI